MKRIIVIAGPTATGKSTLAVNLAKRYNGEIISADAIQLYKHMDIGTAKIPEAKREGISHHLIDILEPDETFSASDYQKMVRDKIALVEASGKTPIVVGGSGLYLKAALYDYDFPGAKRNDADTEKYADMDNQALYLLLQEKDKELASSIHPNNRRRLLRSLEIVSGNDQGTTKGKNDPYYENMLLIGLKMERKDLYTRIDRRVDEIIEFGLVEEAKKLFDAKITGQSISAIGYKELYEYFLGEVTLEAAIELIKRNSRRYAKRQMTWFLNQMDLTWFDVNENNFKETIEAVCDFIEEKGVNL